MVYTSVQSNVLIEGQCSVAKYTVQDFSTGQHLSVYN